MHSFPEKTSRLAPAEIRSTRIPSRLVASKGRADKHARTVRPYARLTQGPKRDGMISGKRNPARNLRINFKVEGSDLSWSELFSLIDNLS